MGRTMRLLVVTGALCLAAAPARADSNDGLAGLTYADDPAVPCQTASIGWRDSLPRGKPFRKGRLVRGVQLPAEGDFFFTWDFPLALAPNLGWRRWGADGTIRTVLTVLCEFRLAHPDAPRVGVADIARTRGGEFGPRFGGEGHASHQNGLDADILYPRLDRLEEAATHPVQVDQVLGQELVDRFVAVGAKFVFVGPHLRLSGPKPVVHALAGHDDHLHVRFRRPLVTKPPPPAPGTNPFPLAPPPID
jgi:murein endopeptidase